ncbi:MAG: 23S rRNA (adenine(2503)-C(2))-methyltransferase RlmN [bacterium]
MNTKINLLGLDLTELQSVVDLFGEPGYRAQQIFQWLYAKQARSFDQMTNLSKKLRQRLVEKAQIQTLKLITSQSSRKDQSIKFLFGLHDGLEIESVLMFENHRATLCLSTQVGCAIDCQFCATGSMGLKRHLTAGEIVDQLICAQQLTGKTVNNIVCMGMGEPFHNYDHLLKACALMSDERGLNLSNKHMVISTSGLVPKIKQFADEGHKYRLAISLNATTDKVRSRLMPLNKKWPIQDLLSAAIYYTKKAKQQVTIEYVLMEGINDREQDAARLKKLVTGLDCKINLIPYNATEGDYRRPSQQRILRFYENLHSLRVPVTVRWSKGDDIAAACGQLAVKSQN